MKKKEKREIEIESPGALTEAEMLEIRLGEEIKKTHEKHIYGLQMQKQLRSEQARFHQAMVENNTLRQRLFDVEIDVQMKRAKDDEEKHKKMVDGIKEKYGIKNNKWGYCPDSGIITEQ